MDTKPCTRCGNTKPLNEFAAHPTAANVRIGVCRTCRGTHMRDVRTARKTTPDPAIPLFGHYEPEPVSPDEYRAKVLQRLRNVRKGDGG